MIDAVYGPSVKGELFKFVHRVCETEMDVTMDRDRTLQWFASQDIFSGYLALNPVELKYPPRRRNSIFLVSEFTLEIDEGETLFAVRRSDEGDLSNDPLAEYVLDQARRTFDGHDHQLCIGKAALAHAVNGTPLPTYRALDGTIIRD